MNKLRLVLYKLGLLRKKMLHKSYREIVEFRRGYPWRDWETDILLYYYGDRNITKIKNDYYFDIKKEHLEAYNYQLGKDVHYEYTSGLIMSDEQFLYGSFEADINIPSGYGFFSAFWLQGQREDMFTEIDIFEYYGSKKKFTYNTHYGTNYDNNLSKGADGIKLKDIEDSWHKYRLDWYEGEDLKIYIDDKLVGVRDGKPFNIPMNLIINMALEGDDQIKLNKSLPTIMKVKNIKYYGI